MTSIKTEEPPRCLKERLLSISRAQEEAIQQLLDQHRQQLADAVSEHLEPSWCAVKPREPQPDDDRMEPERRTLATDYLDSSDIGGKGEADLVNGADALSQAAASKWGTPNLAEVAFVKLEPPETAEVESEGHSTGSAAGGRKSRVSIVDMAPIDEVVDYGRKLLQSDNFSFKSLDLVVGILISVNTIVMMIRNEYQGYEAGMQLGALESNPLSGMDTVLDTLERGFAILFLAELIVRIAVLRCHYFCSCWNWFDVILVGISMFDLFLLDVWMVEYEFNVNVTMMRMARTVKLARAFRIMRTLRLFEGLRVLVHSVSAFLPSLMWAMIFLTLFITTGGILLGGLLHSYTIDTEMDYDRRYWIWRHYGTASRAIYTMFEITFAGSWPMYARPVIEEVNVGYCLFFIAYIVFVVFAVIRVISAIFLKETLDAAQNDAQLVVREKAKASQEYVKRLNKVFQTMDVSQDGVVTKDEFMQLCQDPTIRSYMTSLDVDVNDGSHLFKLLDDGDGHLTYDEFISGMMRFKGNAKAIDVIYLQREVEWMQAELLRLVDSLIGPNPKGRGKARQSGDAPPPRRPSDVSVQPPDLPHDYLNTLMQR
ncbi:unnamed protein product [Effrenium voratum]|nr:unnamed protein product [Effrenium voratum]